MASKRPRLLFVEDEVLIQIAAGEDLREQGFDVVVAGTAKAAIEAVQSGIDGFAAAIIDIGLPDGGGDALAADFRSISKRLPIVIVSGYDKDVVSARFGDDPHLTFLRKPYRGAQLVAALAELNVVGPSVDGD